MTKHQTNLGALYNTPQKFQGHEKKKRKDWETANRLIGRD